VADISFKKTITYPTFNALILMLAQVKKISICAAKAEAWDFFQ
jgi:hypothetical protein